MTNHTKPFKFNVKIYRAWTNSDHHIQYTIGYFMSKESAEIALKQVRPTVTATCPDCGVEEIEVLP